jgi:hypothetical protein
MNNQSFSKIWIIIILVVFIAGGILAWQYFGIPKEETPEEKVPEGVTEKLEEVVKDETANWKTYRNEEFGFEIKYPSTLKLSSMGPNLEQQKLERGETISGTVQPSYDTIVFSDEDDKEQFRVEIFHPYKKDISEKNYGSLHLFGRCDLRWEFHPTSIQTKNINNIKILEVKGKELGPPYKKIPTLLGCYYFKNHTENLIVLSTDDFENQLDFEKVDSVLRKIISTLFLFEVKEAKRS